MKKLILPFLFVFSLSISNAGTVKEVRGGFERDCHAAGCAMVAVFEAVNGGATAEEAEEAYNAGVEACQNAQ